MAPTHKKTTRVKGGATGRGSSPRTGASARQPARARSPAPATGADQLKAEDRELYKTLSALTKLVVDQAKLKRAIPDQQFAHTNFSLQKRVNILKQAFWREDEKILAKLDRAAAHRSPDNERAYNVVKALAEFTGKVAREGGVVPGSGSAEGGARPRKVPRRR